MWEKLADVSGDNAFFNCQFSVYHPKSTPNKAPVSVSSSKGAAGSTTDSISMDHVQNVSGCVCTWMCVRHGCVCAR